MVSLQSNMQMQHDDLAALFSRTLTFNPQPQAVPREEPKPEPAAAEPIIYSISQHYTHSAHTARPQAQPQDGPQRPSSEPPQSENAHTETLLRHHGVDPTNLTPSQVQLFKLAHPAQQRRLLELWSIYPPTQGGDIPSLAWSSTTMEQEEQLARVRYERANQNQAMSLDGTVVQTGEGKWVQDSEADSEPYMASGYEELMRREYERQAQQEQEQQAQNSYSTFANAVRGSGYTPATDPVYMGPDYARQQQQMDMATQYGSFQAFRGNEVDSMDVM